MATPCQRQWLGRYFMCGNLGCQLVPAPASDSIATEQKQGTLAGPCMAACALPGQLVPYKVNLRQKAAPASLSGPCLDVQAAKHSVQASCGQWCMPDDHQWRGGQWRSASLPVGCSRTHAGRSPDFGARPVHTVRQAANAVLQCTDLPVVPACVLAKALQLQTQAGQDHEQR